jgi:methylmalonyl-CoA mutase C-terminal domain/subunit
MIVNAALQEDVDIDGLSILSGAHKELCSRIVSLLRQKGMDDIPVIVGGIIPDGDVLGLKKMGIQEVFGPGTTTTQVVSCVQGLVKEKGQPPRRK